MKKQNPRKMKRLATKQSIYYMIYIAAALVLVFFIYYSLTKEESGFMSLRNDMKSLQQSFNTVDKGWVYKESCRGKGGDFDRDVPSSCAISITNTTVDFSADQKNSILAYSEIISTNQGFNLKQGVTPTSNNISFISYTYSKIARPTCVFNSYREKDSTSGTLHFTFGCSSESNKFYFPRNDL